MELSPLGCAQALKNLFYVPRFRGHTIIHPVTAKYGRVKVHAYPMTSGSGVRASKLMESICRLAGLENIGIKVCTFGRQICPSILLSFWSLLQSITASRRQNMLFHRKNKHAALLLCCVVSMLSAPGQLIFMSRVGLSEL